MIRDYDFYVEAPINKVKRALQNLAYELEYESFWDIAADVYTAQPFFGESNGTVVNLQSVALDLAFEVQEFLEENFGFVEELNGAII